MAVRELSVSGPGANVPKEAGYLIVVLNSNAPFDSDPALNP